MIPRLGSAVDQTETIPRDPGRRQMANHAANGKVEISALDRQVVRFFCAEDSSVSLH